jgi:hypothetical protein
VARWLDVARSSWMAKVGWRWLDKLLEKLMAWAWNQSQNGHTLQMTRHSWELGLAVGRSGKKAGEFGEKSWRLWLQVAGSG